jgi:hypothetical protein
MEAVMGYDSQCAYRLDGEPGTGTALLEQQALVVRGTTRLTIPLADVKAATADGGWLTVRSGSHVAELQLGAAAARWAARITNPPSRLSKLGVKAGQRILIAGPIDAAFAAEIAAAGAILLTRASATPVDLVFYAVERPAALDRLAALAASLTPAGALWTLRTKGRGPVSEAETMAAGKRAGLVDVKVVSFSDTITAEKFVIPVARRAAAGRRTPTRAR